MVHLHQLVPNSHGQYALNRLFNNSPVFSQIKGPNQVKNRYLTEDIAYGLVLWSSLGKHIGVPTPNTDAIITIASTILERDFFEEGLTIEDYNNHHYNSRNRLNKSWLSRHHLQPPLYSIKHTHC